MLKQLDGRQAEDLLLIEVRELCKALHNGEGHMRVAKEHTLLNLGDVDALLNLGDVDVLFLHYAAAISIRIYKWLICSQ